jgi:hypothetical protein
MTDNETSSRSGNFLSLRAISQIAHSKLPVEEIHEEDGVVSSGTKLTNGSYCFLAQPEVICTGMDRMRLGRSRSPPPTRLCRVISHSRRDARPSKRGSLAMNPEEVRGEMDVSSCTRSTSRWRVVPLESDSESHSLPISRN